MKKKLLSIFLVGILLLNFSGIVFASTKDSTIMNPIPKNNRCIGYTFFYKTTPGVYSYNYGNWRTGPTGFGPAKLSINKESGLNRGFTSTISGSWPVGISTINTLLGVSIGQSINHGTSYTISIESGKRKTILYRPKYIKYKVKQEYYQQDTWTGEKKLLSTSVAYVTKFNAWDYSWKYGY